MPHLGRLRSHSQTYDYAGKGVALKSSITFGPDDGSIFESGQTQNVSGSDCESVSLTADENQSLEASSFWIESVSQTIVGILVSVL